jgi:methylated-DNA-protein-cysteine methyltransferase related protein
MTAMRKLLRNREARVSAGSSAESKMRRAGSGELAAIREAVRRIPAGKVATYGQVAAAAGYPGHARQTVWALRLPGSPIPWHRVVGAGGKIRLSGTGAIEQVLRLQAEGVETGGNRVPLKRYGHSFETPNG